jgi:hypothetical protein
MGSPFVEHINGIESKNLPNYYRYACENKMALSYLESLNKLGKIGFLKIEYDRLNRRYSEIERAIFRVSKMLQSLRVDYAFFKSIKPYSEVTVDIDVLIFGFKYQEVVQEMHSAGYAILGHGPLSTTFRDVEASVDFDIYNEIGVSHIIYIDKSVFAHSSITKKLLNGHSISILPPAADLLAIIAHSIIKEQMYVLSEYYTTLSYLATMRNIDVSSLVSLAYKCHLHTAAGTHLEITALLHKIVYGCIPQILEDLLTAFDADHHEISRVSQTSFSMPHKYHPITVVRALIEKSEEERARRSIALQMISMLNISFTSGLLIDAFHHALRKTY